MKTIIAGSRGFKDKTLIAKAVEASGFVITEVVSGTARGIDKFGEQWAKENKIPVKQFPAEWKEYGKLAGFYRNHDMADYADALIAIWDGQSRGTKHMINIAKVKGLKMSVFLVHP